MLQVKLRLDTLPGKDYILLPLWVVDPPFSFSSKDSPDAGFKPSGEEEKKDAEDPGNEGGNPREKDERVDQENDANVNNTNNINTVSPTVNAAGIEDNAVDENIVYGCDDDPNMPDLEEIDRFSDAEDYDSEADINNLDTYFQIILYSNKTSDDKEFGRIMVLLSTTLNKKQVIKDSKIACLLCFLSQEEPKKVWTLMDLPNDKRAIGTKWVYMNKKDERDIVIKNKVRLVSYGYTQEEGIDYDEFFAPIARIEAIWLFLAYALFKDSVVYQMDVKSAFLYGKIEEEVYVCQPPGFEDPDFPDKVYKVEKALYGLHQALRACDVKIASTPMETHKPLLKDTNGEDVDEHLYRSMIGSLMYLTSSRPDIMFAVCACARFQVNPKSSHLHAVKRIFRYLKDNNSDYAGASLERKYIIGGCQFLGCRLVSWQCKKQIMVANFTTEAEYIAASNYCRHVLWIQNQLLDYGYNFMQTKIHIDNKSTICIVKNPIFHSKTKYIEIKHHFIRDSYEKKLIQMIKIRTDQNVAGCLEWNERSAKDEIGFMLLGINLQLPLKVNAVKHKLTTAGAR
ncbi:putative reverse transcriptase, RNA-dependent DNA polymerase [Tanacetum coccineum]